MTSVVAVSGDDEERATRTVDECGPNQLPVAYDLSVERMREWDLYVSKGVKNPEPAQFNEPGLFLVRPDGTCTPRTCSPCRSRARTWTTS